MGWFRNKRDRPIFHAPCPRRFHLLAAIVMVSARAGMMRLLKMLFCFFFSMKGFSCSAISSSSFPSSLSVPVFCSSVALLRRFPCCSYRWHTRAITHSYRQDKKRAVPSCSPLFYAMPLSGSVSFLAPSPRIVGARRFFSSHRLISSRRLAILSASVPRLISSRPTCRMIAGRGESRSCASFFVSCRVVSSHQMKASKTTGRGSLLRPISSVSVRGRFISMPSSSRSSSRPLVSSSVSARAVGASHASHQASKTTGRDIPGFSSRRPAPLSMRRACHPWFP